MPIMSPILSRKLSLLAIALPMLAGCIEWDHQEVRYRYDAKADRLRIFQNYEGIYGADKKDSLSSSERSQLKSVLAGGRTFFFANWIVEINLPEVKGNRFGGRRRVEPGVVRDAGITGEKLHDRERFVLSEFQRPAQRRADS
ncbi:MAG: hypothetical protein CMO80_12660 [Verrucomicrobiales bacterium]|nr:hypothetical protein [Verrucomicrobiales bacterium]